MHFSFWSLSYSLAVYACVIGLYCNCFLSYQIFSCRTYAYHLIFDSINANEDDVISVVSYIATQCHSYRYNIFILCLLKKSCLFYHTHLHHARACVMGLYYVIVCYRQYYRNIVQAVAVTYYVTIDLVLWYFCTPLSYQIIFVCHTYHRIFFVFFVFLLFIVVVLLLLAIFHHSCISFLVIFRVKYLITIGAYCVGVDVAMIVTYYCHLCGG